MLKHLTIIACILAAPAISVAQIASQMGDPVSAEKPFVKKRYTIHGSAKVEQIDGETRLVFSEDFKTKSGPDLKLYLSKMPLSTLSAQDIDQNAVRLSVLKSHRGTQSYLIPADIDISEYESVVIQCEAYTVLWGGFDL